MRFAGSRGASTGSGERSTGAGELVGAGRVDQVGAPHAALDWRIVVPFTALAVVGSVLGKRVADRLSADVQSRAFAVLLVLVGGYVAARALGVFG